MSPPSQLSNADVLRLMKEPSAEVRAEVAGKLAKDIDNPTLTAHEIELAREIITLMAKDVEVMVRKALSYSLRHARRLPHDIAVNLASDVEAVALPMLEHSTVLTDADLITIIRAGSASKQEAIAGRANVSEQLSDVLIAEATEKAVTNLMNNTSAKIAPAAYTKAIDRFGDSDSVKEAMVKRPSLPITVAERLTVLVSDQLRDYLVGHHELPERVASDLVLETRERLIVNMAFGQDDQDVEKLVLQMFRNRRLTPSVVFRALCMGDLAFFEAALAVMANVPVINARILIHDAGRLGLKTIYEKTGMPMRLLPGVKIALDVIHETKLTGENYDRETYRARVIERVLTQFEDLGKDDLDYLLGKLSDVMEVSIQH